MFSSLLELKCFSSFGVSYNTHFTTHTQFLASRATLTCYHDRCSIFHICWTSRKQNRYIHRHCFGRLGFNTTNMSLLCTVYFSRSFSLSPSSTPHELDTFRDLSPILFILDVYKSQEFQIDFHFDAIRSISQRTNGQKEIVVLVWFHWTRNVASQQ